MVPLAAASTMLAGTMFRKISASGGGDAGLGGVSLASTVGSSPTPGCITLASTTPTMVATTVVAV